MSTLIYQFQPEVVESVRTYLEAQGVLYQFDRSTCTFTISDWEAAHRAAVAAWGPIAYGASTED